MAIRFDKLRFVKKLQDANQSPEIAEAFADAIDEALEQSQSALATKTDIDHLEAKIDIKMAQLETKLTEAMYKMAGFIIAGVGAMLGLFRFFG